MKKMIIAACLLAFTATTTFAQDVKVAAAATKTAPAATTAATQDDNKTKVDPASLPDAVKTTLAGEQYKGWTPSSAWLVKTEPSYYAVELKKDDKTNVVNIDKEGKVK